MIVITTMESLPDHCYECPCHNGESGYCQADKERRYSLEYRPYWCPLKEIYEGRDEQDNCENCAIAIEDRQPVIRCKDCKHRDPEDGRCDNGHDVIWNLPRPDNWFCKDGERREMNENL